MKQKLREQLIGEALAAREQAYAPYSGFAVGAALLAEDGSVWSGCNVENAAFGAGCCAERTALWKAVSEGRRRFTAICVVGGPAGRKTLPCCPPCGICRQALREFVSPEDFELILAQDEAHYQEMKLEQLLPLSFGPEALPQSSQ